MKTSLQYLWRRQRSAILIYVLAIIAFFAFNIISMASAAHSFPQSLSLAQYQQHAVGNNLSNAAFWELFGLMCVWSLPQRHLDPELAQLFQNSQQRFKAFTYGSLILALLASLMLSLYAIASFTPLTQTVARSLTPWFQPIFFFIWNTVLFWLILLLLNRIRTWQTRSWGILAIGYVIISITTGYIYRNNAESGLWQILNFPNSQPLWTLLGLIVLVALTIRWQSQHLMLFDNDRPQITATRKI